MDPLILTGPTPVAHRVRNAFVPVIYHPDRGAEYLRNERYPRKAKATAAEAIEYARRVIHYRHVRAAEKRRRREAIDPRLAVAAQAKPESADFAKLVAWLSNGTLRPGAEDFDMLWLFFRTGAPSLSAACSKSIGSGLRLRRRPGGDRSRPYAARQIRRAASGRDRSIDPR
jgi:hypothetical protein